MNSNTVVHSVKKRFKAKTLLWFVLDSFSITMEQAMLWTRAASGGVKGVSNLIEPGFNEFIKPPQRPCAGNGTNNI